MKYIEVITTFETKEEAREMSKAIIEKKLAACCSIEEIESIYSWKNKVETAEEFQLTIKTKEPLYKQLEEFILKNHPYETPQIISIPILNGSSGYLRWIDEVTK